MTTEQHRREPREPSFDEHGCPVYAAKRVWPAYFDRVAGKPPRTTLLAALDAFEREGRVAGVPPRAIDLGCGDGRDTVELLRRGWRVLAVDGHPDAFRRLRARADLPQAAADRLECLHAPFEGLELPPAVLVSASFSLPFCDPHHFGALWAAVRGAILPGGRFAGQLFGDRDDWASIEDRTHHTAQQARDLLAGLEVELFQEVEDDGKDALDNPKHWHRFDVVARRPPA